MKPIKFSRSIVDLPDDRSCEQIYNIIIQVIEKELSIIENKVT